MTNTSTPHPASAGTEDSFLVMLGLLESAADEQARLAAHPAGSTGHRLSKLPVNIEGYLRGRIIELPNLDGAIGTDGMPVHMVVVPFAANKHATSTTVQDDTSPMKRNDDYFSCMVVASNSASYPAGGHDLSIWEAELVRGTEVAV